MDRRQTAQRPARDPGASLVRLLRTRRGTSLVELLTSTLFVSILATISYSFARAALMSARVQEVKSEAQEVTVMAIDVLTHDLRMAGFSAVGAPLTGVRIADREQVAVAADLDGDGDTSDSNELIAYTYDAEKHDLMRATGGSSPQPLVRNVPRDGVRFAYFDAQGSEIVPDAQLSLERRQRIHRIDVWLHVELPNPDPRVAAPLTATATTSVCLRNQ